MADGTKAPMDTKKTGVAGHGETARTSTPTKKKTTEKNMDEDTDTHGTLGNRRGGARFKAIELFAGAGGAALGLEAAGVHHVALCEWDADACATLRAAGLGPVVEGDVRDLDAIASAAFLSESEAWRRAGDLLLDSSLDGDEWCLEREALATDLWEKSRRLDLLWSSFPCQAWSVAGQRKGASDERNGWPWTVDAIDRFRPRWFIAENVRGLLHHKSDCDRSGPPEDCPGCYFERKILLDLRQRFEVVGWFLLDAADYGVPQHRRRVFIHAGPAPVTPPRATHGPGMFTKPWKSMGEALGLGPGYRFTERQYGARGTTLIVPGRPSPTVQAGSNRDNGLRVISGGRNASDGTRTFRDLTEEPSTTVAAVQIGNAGPWICERPSPCVTATEYKGYSAGAKERGRHCTINRASDALWQGTGRRRLTVEECAILQDFPADHPFQGTKTSRYRQVGNAVPPKLAQVVVKAVLEADRRHQNADRAKPHHHGILGGIVENADE